MAKPCPLTELLRRPFLVCSLDGEVRFAHPLAEKILGRKVRPGLRLNRIFEGPRRGQAGSTLLRSVALGEDWSGFATLRPTKGNKTGREAAITLRVTPGSRRQAWLIFDAETGDQDTTEGEEKPSSEDAQEEVAGLRGALARSEQVVADVTHEIRNPIDAIQGLCETSLESPAADQAGALRKIRACAQELSEIVGDVLEFSRQRHGALALERIAFDPVRTVEEVVARFQPQAGRKGLGLAALIKADSPRSVLGDPVKFRRVAANLLGNAVKFTESGYVHASLEFRRQHGRLRARLQVSDTGIGIPAGRLEKIFEPYAQADASTSRRFGGTGLGLAIVRSLTEAMEGEVRVTSKVGVGSTFSATMMVSPDPAYRPSSSPDLKGQRILLVGGQSAVRRWYADCLAGWGARCVRTDDPKKAESLWAAADAARRPYRWAIVDLPDDVSPRLPAIPAKQVILVTSPEVELRSHAQLIRPLSLTGLRHHFSPGLAPTPDTPSEPGRPGRTRRLRVLLAEDNEVNREVVTARLRGAGHDVSATVDGSAALELWHAKEFDVALLDVRMPIMDGLEVAAAIRAEEKARGRRRTALLALSALTDATDRARCVSAGFDAFVAKPARGADLLARLADLPEPTEAGPAPSPADEYARQVSAAESDEADDLRAAGRAFLRHADKMIGRLCAARDTGQAEALGREAHGVRGMLSLMACGGLARLAHRIEREPVEAIELGCPDELIDGLRKLREALRSRTDLSADG